MLIQASLPNLFEMGGACNPQCLDKDGVPISKSATFLVDKMSLVRSFRTNRYSATGSNLGKPSQYEEVHRK